MKKYKCLTYGHRTWPEKSIKLHVARTHLPRDYTDDDMKNTYVELIDVDVEREGPVRLTIVKGRDLTRNINFGTHLNLGM